MYCSTQQFIAIAEKTGVHTKDLYLMVTTIQSLVQKRGSLVKSVRFQDAVAKAAPEVAKMIHLLGDIDKLNVKSLRDLVATLASKQTGSFEVRGSGDAKITQALEKKFGDIEVSTQESTTPELSIAGNGRWYKRSLERDLDKVLK